MDGPLPIPSPPVGAARRPVAMKLYPPSLRSNLIERPHLLSLLMSEPEARITLICAPAGFGKTTLAVQWLAQLRSPVAWVALDVYDDDPRSFFALIVAGLHTIDDGLASGTEALLAAPGPVRTDAIVDQLIDDLAVTTHPFVLVLDDLQTIASPEVLRGLESLLQHAPLTMRTVLIGRNEPTIRLARFRANGELHEIHQEDLMLSDPEGLQFFRKTFALDLTRTETEMLLRRTEGWIAGCQLLGIALGQHVRDQLGRAVDRFGQSGLFADRYLWSEVLHQQPADVRSFLMQTSILDRFNARLCEAVTGQRQSESLIRRCIRDGLFVIPLDGIGDWYRYHHLFAEVLRDHQVQAATAGEVDELHRRASRWLSGNGFYDDAVRHAIAGHDWDWAIALLEDRCADLYRWDHVASLRDTLQESPDAIFERSPRLAYWLAWALGRTGRWAEGARPFRFAQAAWDDTGNRAGQGELLLWESCRALYGFDNLQAIDLADRALALLPEDRPTERVFALATQGIAHVYRGEPVSAERAFAELRSLAAATGQPWFHLFEMGHSAGSLVQRGELQEAATLCGRVIQAAGDSPVEIWVQAALYHLGTIQLAWGDLDASAEYFRKADRLAEMTDAIQWRGRIRAGLARIAWERGDPVEAFDQLDRARVFATQLGNELEVRSIEAWRARFWLASDRWDLVRAWADCIQWDVSAAPDYERQIERLTYVRFLIRDGRPALALPLLAGIERQAEATGRRGDMVEVAVLQTLAHAARGETAPAARAMSRALELGMPGGYVQVFVDEGGALLPLLRDEALRGVYREYAERLLTEIDGGDVDDDPAPAGSPGVLSEREIEVLRLVAAGMPNREIGQRLFISEKTVKKHMNNVLRKLQAANRTHAVELARQLGLI